MEENMPDGEIQKKTASQSFWELVRFALIAVLIVIPIRFFVVESFIVSGSSMVPTFENANYLIVDKISYRITDPKRYDVIIFRFPQDQSKFFIKRVIGLPNETVSIESGKVTIFSEEYKNGLTLSEPYVKNNSSGTTNFKLKNDEYFVMGDNRSGSSDSRVWGAVKRELVTGRALLRLRLWPINNLVDVLPGSYK